MACPHVTICLPTLEGEHDLERLLPALAAQVGCGALELVAIDSSSTDRTQELLRAAGARLQVIPRAEFRHGGTRNLLAQLAAGEVCVFLSQDALPADPEFLSKLLAPFEDPRVAGVTARVLPHGDDDPLTARTVLAAPEAQAESERRQLDPGQSLAQLAPARRDELVRFNDVASAIRRELLLELPFPDVDFGEDSAWAALALDAGHALVFCAEARVLHAHRYGPRAAFERYRVDAAYQRTAHGVRVRPGIFSVLKGVAYEVCADVRHVAGEGRGWLHLARSPFLRGAQVLGQWFGTHGWNPGAPRL